MNAAPAAPSAPAAPASPATRQGSVTNEMHLGSHNLAPTEEPGAFDSPIYKGLEDLGRNDNEPLPRDEVQKTESSDRKSPQQRRPAPEDDSSKKDLSKEDKPSKEDVKAEAEEDQDDEFMNPTAKKAKDASEEADDETESTEETAKSAAKEQPEVDDGAGKVSGVKQLRNELGKRKSEVATLTKTLETRDKEISELRTKLASKDYTESQEFQEKYVQPLNSKITNAVDEIANFKVFDENGNQRAADYNADFAPLLSLSTEGAIKVATERYGDMAPEILAMRREILQAHKAKLNAANDYRSRAEQIRAEQEERAIRQQEKALERFTEFREELKSDARHKSLFAPGDDRKHKQLLEQGEELVKQGFTPSPGVRPDDLLRTRAAIANRAVVAGVLARKVKQMEQEIAELKKYRSATPGLGDGSAVPGSIEDDPFAALERYATIQ